MRKEFLDLMSIQLYFERQKIYTDGVKVIIRTLQRVTLDMFAETCN